MFSNKETISCFYCKWTGRKDKLASHSNAHRPGSKILNRLRKDQVEKIAWRNFLEKNPAVGGENFLFSRRFCASGNCYNIFCQHFY
jgi:hypothetical protein